MGRLFYYQLRKYYMIYKVAYVKGCVCDTARSWLATYVALFFIFAFTGSRAENSIEILRELRISDKSTVVMGYDRSTGKGFRGLRDDSTQKILASEVYSGRPQSSPVEFRYALEIINKDPEIASVSLEGSIPEGGFIVDGPKGKTSTNRFIQIRLLSPDRRQLLCVVLVNLTEKRVASVSKWFD